MKTRKLQIQVADSLQGLRLDRVLANHPDIGTRSRAGKLLDLGLVQVKGRLPKSSYLVQSTDEITVDLPVYDEGKIEPLDLPLDIVFEDKDLIVLNKPAGLVVHPAAGHSQDTLVNALVHHTSDLSMGFSEKRPGIVHRLDKDTSGLLVVAKNDFTHAALAQQFKEKSVHRIYWALVYGVPNTTKGRIESYLLRHPKDRKRFASLPRSGPSLGSAGKRAVTHYNFVQSKGTQFSLIHCKLETGRTHQIRVHLSELGHPILGDSLYGSTSRLKSIDSSTLRKQIGDMKRIGLHAAELGFTHPRTHVNMVFKSDWPRDLLFLAELLK